MISPRDFVFLIKNIIVLVTFITALHSLYIHLAVGYVLRLFFPSTWDPWICLLKQSFGLLAIFIIRFTSPATMKIYSSSPRASFATVNGVLESTLASRALVVANHQTYADWLYIWWFAYTADLHGSLSITLKDELRKIPVFGFRKDDINFLFLKRKWDEDKQSIDKLSKKLCKDPSWPLWMLMYPEGTVVNPHTHELTTNYAHKAGIPLSKVPRNMLLPRAKGLKALLTGLSPTISVMYDFTVVYEPVTQEAAETHFSLIKTFLFSRGAKVIKLHVREFKLDEIPFNESEEEFADWLNERWSEKDKIYEMLANGDLENQLKATVPMRLRNWLELYHSVSITLTLALVIWLIYKMV